MTDMLFFSSVQEATFTSCSNKLSSVKVLFHLLLLSSTPALCLSVALCFCVRRQLICVCAAGSVLDHECDSGAFSHSESKLKGKLAYM